MGFSLKNFLEEAWAQAVPGDNKTAATVRASRQPAQPAVTQRKQPGQYYNFGTQSATNVNPNQNRGTFNAQYSNVQPQIRNTIATSRFLTPEQKTQKLTSLNVPQPKFNVAQAGVQSAIQAPGIVAKSVAKPFVETADFAKASAQLATANATGNRVAANNARTNRDQSYQQSMVPMVSRTANRLAQTPISPTYKTNQLAEKTAAQAAENANRAAQQQIAKVNRAQSAGVIDDRTAAAYRSKLAAYQAVISQNMGSVYEKKLQDANFGINDSKARMFAQTAGDMANTASMVVAPVSGAALAQMPVKQALRTAAGDVAANMVFNGGATAASAYGQGASLPETIRQGTIGALTTIPMMGAGYVTPFVKKGVQNPVATATKANEVMFTPRKSLTDQYTLRDLSDHYAGVKELPPKVLSDTIREARNIAARYGVELTSGTPNVQLERINSLLDTVGQRNQSMAQGGYVKLPGSKPDPLEALKAETSYRSAHQIDSKTARNLGDMQNIDDVVTQVKSKYGLTNYDQKDIASLKKIIGNPEADVKIYRASPVNEINNGDWVTTSKTYANDIKRQNGGKVYEYTVKAKDLNLPANIEDNPSLARFSAFQYNQATKTTNPLQKLKDINTKLGEGGYVKNPFYKEPELTKGLSKEQSEFINQYANMLEDMGSGNGVAINRETGTRLSNNYRTSENVGKRMTKADWFEQARKDIESGKAGYGASEEYKAIPGIQGAPAEKTPQAGKPDPTAALKQEALKYKSAEEFIAKDKIASKKSHTAGNGDKNDGNPQSARIKGDSIVVTNRHGRKQLDSYEIPLEKWEQLEKSFGNPNYNIKQFIKSLNQERMPGNYADIYNSSFIDRLEDNQISAIKSAVQSQRRRQQLTDLYNQAHTQPTPKVEAPQPTVAPVQKPKPVSNAAIPAPVRATTLAAKQTRQGQTPLVAASTARNTQVQPKPKQSPQPLSKLPNAPEALVASAPPKKTVQKPQSPQPKLVSEQSSPFGETIPQNGLPVYGTKKTSAIDKAFRSTRSIIERQGEKGKQLAGMLQQQRDSKELWARDIERRLPTVKKLNDKEYANFVNATQGEELPLNSKVTKAITEWRSVHPEIRDRAIKAGLDVGDLGETYYPHFIDFDKVFKDKNTYNAAINHLVKTGQAPNAEEAIKLLGYARDVSRNRQFGNLEASRMIDIPFYDRTKASLGSYIQGSADRITKTEIFGKSDENALKLIADSAVDGADTEAMKNAYDIAVGAKKYNPTSQKISGAIRKYNTVTRLGLGALTNVSQNVNTGIVTGHMRTLGAIMKQLSPEARRWADDTGVISDAVINDLKHGSGYETFGSTKLGKGINLITAPGFKQVETLNRRVAATAGRDYALRLAQKGDTTTLRKLGVTGEIKGNTLTDAQQVQAARKIVEKTQFKVDPQDLPGWADSPGGKLVAQFRTFSYNQGKFFSNEILKPMAKGNYIPLARLMAALPLGFALYEARRVIDGRPEEENPTKIALQSFQKVGGAGLVFDIYQSLNPIGSKYLPSDRRQSMAASGIGGPTVGTAMQAIGAASDLIQRKNTPEDTSRLDGKVAIANTGNTYTDATPAARFALQQIPIVGTPIKNRLLPFKKESEADTGKLPFEGKASAASLTEKQRNAQIKLAFGTPEGKAMLALKTDAEKEKQYPDLFKQYKAMQKGMSDTSVKNGRPKNYDQLSNEARAFYDQQARLTDEGKKNWLNRKTSGKTADAYNSINAWKPKGYPDIPNTNKAAEIYAKFESDSKAGNWKGTRYESERKKALREAYETALDDNEKYLWGASDKQVYDAIENGEVPKETLDKLVQFDDLMIRIGGSAKFSKKFRKIYGYNAAPTDGTGYNSYSSSGGRKSKVAKGKYDLTDLISVTSTANKSLRQLLEDTLKA